MGQPPRQRRRRGAGGRTPRRGEPRRSRRQRAQRRPRGNLTTQRRLSRPRLLTLPWSRWQAGYRPAEATDAAFRRTPPAALAGLLSRHWRRFADPGLDGLDADATQGLIVEYLAVDHPGAAEMVAWLRGETRLGQEVTQA